MELRPEFSDEAARGFVWEAFPELHQEFGKAAPEPPVKPLAKARGGEDWYQARLRKSAEEREAGATYAAIADGMNSDGIPTAQGGVKWWPSTVRAVAVR